MGPQVRFGSTGPFVHTQPVAALDRACCLMEQVPFCTSNLGVALCGPAILLGKRPPPEQAPGGTPSGLGVTLHLMCRLQGNWTFQSEFPSSELASLLVNSSSLATNKSVLRPPWRRVLIDGQGPPRPVALGDGTCFFLAPSNQCGLLSGSAVGCMACYVKP